MFRFGISGAPLSQYVHMVEREAARFAPDVVVIVLVHNDFDESFRSPPGRYTSSFFKLRIEGATAAGEIAPIPYSERWKDTLRQTALARYFYYRWGVRPETVRAGVARLFGVREQGGFEANVDIATLGDSLADMRAATDYLFGRLKVMAECHNFRPLLVMDGVRHAIYLSGGGAARELNLMAADAAARHDLAFIDLHPIFAADWTARRERFEFAADGHWNRRGHQIAAEAVRAWLRQRADRFS